MENHRIMFRTLNLMAHLLLLAIAIRCATSARVLDEDPQPVGSVAAPDTTNPVVPPVTVATSPAAVVGPTQPTNPVVPPVTVATSPAAVVGPTQPTNPVVPPVTVATSPAAVVAPTQPSGNGATTTSATVADAEPHHPLTFFMHDVLGGSHPSTRVVTGIVASSTVNGQLPFAKNNNGAVLPINGGVPLLNGNNGVINNNNNNGPFLTGLGGQSTTTINGNNINGGNSLPFVAAGQLPVGSTLQKLMFGTITVIDDELTEGHELGSAVIGKAQGFYVASSEDGSSQTVAFTAMFEDDHYANSLSFFGVHRTVSTESQVAIIGGTGKYANAKGYAAIQTLHPVDQHTTDGVETLLEFTIYLSY
ncbi:dirigent protein 9-like [Magnolia sinica]|uniref:dirigent protein 9-like n=1 Tax=Magnolia sinica TaxID=86752 RepID=UPI0026586FF6|nr:dirigent protein 9-like [Magnolia sinica]